MSDEPSVALINTESVGITTFPQTCELSPSTYGTSGLGGAMNPVNTHSRFGGSPFGPLTPTLQR